MSGAPGVKARPTWLATFADGRFDAAALDADLEAVYLPRSGNSPSAPADEAEAVVHSAGSPMVFTGTFANWQGTVKPAGLEGAYLEEYGGTGLAKGAARFSLRPDGRYDLIEADLDARPIAFVPLQADIWLAIEEHSSIYDGKPDRRYTFQVLKRQSYGWSLDDLSLGASVVPELTRERRRAMGIAATRHGMHYDGNYLYGETTPSGLIDLLRDGQFSLGISFQSSLERLFYRHSEISRRFTTPARP